MFTCNGTPPDTSNVNYFANAIEPNAVLANLTPTGTISIDTRAASGMIVDVNGSTT